MNCDLIMLAPESWISAAKFLTGIILHMCVCYDLHPLRNCTLVSWTWQLDPCRKTLMWIWLISMGLYVSAGVHLHQLSCRIRALILCCHVSHSDICNIQEQPCSTGPLSIPCAPQERTDKQSVNTKFCSSKGTLLDWIHFTIHFTIVLTVVSYNDGIYSCVLNATCKISFHFFSPLITPHSEYWRLGVLQIAIPFF